MAIDHHLPDGRTLSGRQLAQELGISHTTLQRWLKDASLTAILQRRPHRILALGPETGEQEIVSKMVWCQPHQQVLAHHGLLGWLWEPLLPGMFDKAAEYAAEFGYTLRILTGACPQCAKEVAA